MATTVAAGQLVRVTGYARERFSQTTLTARTSNTAAVPASSICRLRRDALPVSPTAVMTALREFDFRSSAYEGMLSRFRRTL